jgi:hypothetical protein
MQTNQNVKSKGVPGLTFETWDPSNRTQMETPLSPLSSRAKPRDLQFHSTPSPSRYQFFSIPATDSSDPSLPAISKYQENAGKTYGA